MRVPSHACNSGLWRVLSFAVLAGCAFMLAIGQQLAPVAPSSGRVKPIPAVQGHINAAALTDPPDTAFCEANLFIACYAPSQIRTAYNLQPLYDRGLTGAGRTIVIVDAFGSPTIVHDLHTFDLQYGLPDPNLQIIAPAGTPPPFDPNNEDHVGWAEETTLDVEWAHVIAPGANILLVVTPVAETEGVTGFPEIVQAENFVIDHNLGDVISQSFGATEQTFPNKSSLLNLRSAFINARRHHVTVLGSSGDNGATDAKLDLSCCFPFRVNSWPSSDPLVTSIGGTQLHLDAAGNRLSPDSVWNDSCDVSATACIGAGGGGVSSVFPRPGFQDDVERVVNGHRGTPDVSLSAAVDGGVIVYFTFIRPTSPWHIFGGTSASSPMFSGVVAIADQAAGRRLGWLNPSLYRLDNGRGLKDVTRGNNTFIFCSSAPATCGTSAEVDTKVVGFNATRGYDLASGLGTIDAAALVRALADNNRNDDNFDDQGMRH
jgi:subtilase family serine protease